MRNAVITSVAASLLVAHQAHAQSPGSVQLRIDIEKTVNYYQDVSEYSKFATEPGPKGPASSLNFASGVSVADIVAVNGEPAKGTAIGQQITLATRPSPSPGQVVADVFSGGLVQWILDIQSASDSLVDQRGAPFSIGTIIIQGLAGDARPLGLSIVGGGNFSVIGGTGAYVGARGQAAFSSSFTPSRAASYTEDPANRRSLGGGTFQLWINLIPFSRPEVVTTAGGPAIVHSSDNSQVSSASPARAGEVLTLYATGCGPTGPTPDPGQLFQASPLSIVQSPLRITVNGVTAEVLYAGGYPGTEDTYQVNFRIPSGVAPGPAALHLTTAWISGKDVTMAVR